MKKLIFIVIIVSMMACMVACSNTSDADNGVDIPADTVVTPEVTTAPAVPELPKLSDEFINTALRFIDEYPASSKKLENLAAEVIQQSKSDVFKDKLYAYLTYQIKEKYPENITQFLGYGCESIHTVSVWIHNYEVGGNVGCAAFNGQEPFYNYEHDKLILAAGIVGEKYPDNVTLAEAKVASYVLLQMDAEDVDCCISTTSEGKKSYDFTFENEAFKNLAREILQDLCES